MSLLADHFNGGDAMNWPVREALPEPPGWSVSLHETGRITVADVNGHYRGESTVGALLAGAVIETPSAPHVESVTVPQSTVERFQSLGKVAADN